MCIEILHFASVLRRGILLTAGLSAGLPGVAETRTATELLAARDRAFERMEVVPFKRLTDVTSKRRNKSGRLVAGDKIDRLDLRLSILRPADAAEGVLRPAILFFHGGGFRAGSPAQFFVQADMFADRGAVAICVEYRLKDKVEVTIAQQVSDARDAIRWVRRNAAVLGVDPTQIIAAGGSAGGYLALASALLPGAAPETRPDAIVALNPAIEFDSFVGSRGIGHLEASLGGAMEIFSGTSQLRPGLPPIILFQGETDEVTPLAVAETFTAQAQSLHLICELVVYPQVGHGFLNRDPYIASTMRRAIRFLGDQGFVFTASEGP